MHNPVLPAWSAYSDCALLEILRQVDHHPPEDFRPLLLGSQRIGWLAPAHVHPLCANLAHCQARGAAVIWDADLSWHERGWLARAFRGTRWQAVHDERARRFRLNAYRVLLTRARQGMVWVVPQGDDDDPTRQPGVYDAIWDALCELGLPVLT